MVEGDRNLKETVAVIILAVLVVAAFSMLSAPSVRAEASEAHVLSYSWYVAPANTVIAENAGDLIAVGEVQNVGSTTLSNVTVTGVAYDSSENVLATTSTQAFVYDMLPGQKAPFYLDFTAESSTTDDLSWVPSVSNVTVSVTSAVDTTATQYNGLAIPNGGSTHFLLDNNETFTVAGYVNNTGSETIGKVWVVATFYNSAGTVVSLNYTDYLCNSLAPDAMVSFLATPVDDTAQLTNEIANYTLLIDSAPLTGSALPSSQPSSIPTGSHSASTAQLPATTIVGIVVGVVVVVIVVVTALVLLGKRQKLPTPPPPPPPAMS